MAYPLAYPLEVLSTNRILGTSLIKQKPGQFQLLPQLKELYSGGIGNLYRGFIPSMLAALLRNAPTMFVITHGAVTPETFFGQNLVWAALGSVIANPMENMTVRYQSVEFQRTSLSQDFNAMWAEHSTSLFRTGLWHAIARNVIIALTITTASAEDQISPFTTAMVAAVLSHPFEYLRVRQQCGVAEKLVGENTFQAMAKVAQTHGVQELYKGFGARGLLYLMYAEALAYQLANKE